MEGVGKEMGRKRIEFGSKNKRCDGLLRSNSGGVDMENRVGMHI